MTDNKEQLLREALCALIVAEAGLADIGDSDREPGDDLQWCEARAAQALALPRAAIIALSAAIAHLAAQEPEWVDDPHDIEQGMMRNPKWKPATNIAQPEQTAPGLSLNLLERLSKTLTRLGYATPEGGMEHFNADLANQLYSLCQAVDNIFDRAQPEQKAEQNFCARCGKRLAGDGIHTCTPPKAKQ